MQNHHKKIKRVIDINLSIVGIISFSPIWLLSILLIKLESPGHIIIRQTRIGLHSKPFTLYKFRTMRSEALLYEKSPSQEDDSRVTRLGKILRRYSIDEIPQFINILKGDMSLVGPRPELPFIVAGYNEEQRQRLKVKPGLTGLWQISGRKDIPLQDNLEYDYRYVREQSLKLDLMILFKTIPAVISGRGAY